METYRFDQYNSVYKYSAEHQAYLFIAKRNGRSKKEVISDIENMWLNELLSDDNIMTVN